MKSMGVYFLLDASASMHGPKIQVLNDGYDLILSRMVQIFAHEYELSLSVLFYENEPIELFFRVPILPKPALPSLKATGPTRTSRAFVHLAGWLARASDDRALVFWLTDSIGSDNYDIIPHVLAPYRERLSLVGIGIQSHVPLASAYPLDVELDITQIDRLQLLLEQEASSWNLVSLNEEGTSDEPF
jgi:uncharacterized protein YegL